MALHIEKECLKLSLTRSHTNSHMCTHNTQLIFVNINFGSPRPKAAVLEISSDSGLTYRPIQYYADDCMMYFNLPNDGVIVNADDVNCITSQSL